MARNLLEIDPASQTDCNIMGLSHGLNLNELSPKQKHRWLFSIPDVSAQPNSTKTLPPRKGARPGVSFKEQEFQHLSETIYYPLKAEWKTVNLVLYDIRCNKNPVFDWLRRIYTLSNNSSNSLTFNPCQLLGSEFKKDKALLELYDGCGNTLEQWTFENIYPSSIDWGDLDMDSSDIVVVDLTLRYDRAYMS
jgi:hypothetical protein